MHDRQKRIRQNSLTKRNTSFKRSRHAHLCTKSHQISLIACRKRDACHLQVIEEDRAQRQFVDEKKHIFQTQQGSWPCKKSHQISLVACHALLKMPARSHWGGLSTAVSTSNRVVLRYAVSKQDRQFRATWRGNIRRDRQTSKWHCSHAKPCCRFPLILQERNQEQNAKRNQTQRACFCWVERRAHSQSFEKGRDTGRWIELDFTSSIRSPSLSKLLVLALWGWKENANIAYNRCNTKALQRSWSLSTRKPPLSANFSTTPRSKRDVEETFSDDDVSNAGVTIEPNV